MKTSKILAFASLVTASLLFTAAPVYAYVDGCAASTDAPTLYPGYALPASTFGVWCGGAVGNSGGDPAETYQTDPVNIAFTSSWSRHVLCAYQGDVLIVTWFREAAYIPAWPPGTFKGANVAFAGAPCASVSGTADVSLGDVVGGGRWVYQAFALNTDTDYRMIWAAAL